MNLMIKQYTIIHNISFKLKEEKNTIKTVIIKHIANVKFLFKSYVSKRMGGAFIMGERVVASEIKFQKVNKRLSMISSL